MITSFFKPKSKKKSGAEVTAAADSTPIGTALSSSHKRLRNSSDKNNSTEPPTLSQSTVSSTSTSAMANSSHKRIRTADRPKYTAEVDELLQHLDNDTAKRNENEGDAEAEKDESTSSWKQALESHFMSPGFAKLAQFVQSERAGQHTIYPSPNNTFTCLNITPLSSVKVVIVGQDPYHGPRQAHGLCFSVEKGVDVPPSLKNIYKELINDPDIDFPKNKVSGPPRHGYLMNWAQQGVLLLNTVLTVRKGQANSHQKKGWEAFTDQVIQTVDRHSRAKQQGVVFLLWGKPATTKAQALLSSAAGSRHQYHTIITTSHPSPLGASKTNQPFLGSRCFSRCNQALKEKGLEPIDWNVD